MLHVYLAGISSKEHHYFYRDKYCDVLCYLLLQDDSYIMFFSKYSWDSLQAASKEAEYHICWIYAVRWWFTEHMLWGGSSNLSANQLFLLDQSIRSVWQRGYVSCLRPFVTFKWPPFDRVTGREMKSTV